MKSIYLLLLVYAGLITTIYAQTKCPLIKATQDVAVIQDGEQIKLNWHLDPKARPDIYYVNVPRRKSKVTFQTDQGKLSFKTHYGESYDLVVLLNEKDSCFVRIVAKEPRTGISLQMQKPLPDTIPFIVKGSRIYLPGLLNEKEPVSIQFDLGAGGCCVNKMSSGKLNLLFNATVMVKNSQGTNEARKSTNNKLTIGHLQFNPISLAEVGNMDAHEDVIIGYGLFRDKIIEIDYDKKVFIVQDKLPDHAKKFTKQPVVYEQNGPKFKASFVQNGKKYWFWFGFDTGRDGAMRIGDDLTALADNWKNLKALTILNDGRKIVRLNATIAGIVFKDIVTNAADPSRSKGRSTIFGNQVLNHFNVILDNQNGYIYLKANSRSKEPYFNYQSYIEEMRKGK